MKRGFFALPFVLAVGSAHASWPVYRGDATRSGTAMGVGDLTKPAPYFRAFLGGSLEASQLLAPLELGGGKRGLAIATAGRVKVLNASGVVAWESAALGVAQLVGVADLDGDKSLELVARSADRVFVFDLVTGTLRWALPVGEMGTIGVTRLADVDGDGLTDLFVQECGCCARTSGKTGQLYSFRAGADKPVLAWSLPSIVCVGAFASAVVQDGSISLAFGTDRGISLVDGKTGAVVATSGDLGPATGYSMCRAISPAAASGAEIVLCSNNFTYSGAGRGHRVLALKRAGSTLTTLYDVNVGDADGALTLLPEVAADLDLDGTRELVVSGSVGGATVLEVRNLSTGAVLASRTNSRPAGVWHDETGKPVLLATDEAGTKLLRYAGGALTVVGELPAVTPAVVFDFAGGGRGSFGGLTATIDLDGDGQSELLTLDQTALPALTAWRAAAKPVALATYKAPTGVAVSGVWTTAGLNRATNQVLVGQSDGRVDLLDGSLKPTIDAFRAGGYLARGGFPYQESAIIAGPLGDGKKDSILVTDSRLALVRFDPIEASLTGAAKPVWSHPATFGASIAASLDKGKPAIACGSAVNPTDPTKGHKVVALRPDGTTLYEKEVGGVLFGDVTTTTEGPDLVALWGKQGDGLVSVVRFKGTDGALTWTSPFFDSSSGRQPRPYALGDWNGDKVTDVVLQSEKTIVVDGVGGLKQAESGGAYSYAAVSLRDFTGDGKLDALLHGAPVASYVLDHDLTTKVWTGDATRPFPLAASFECSSVARVAYGSFDRPSRLTIEAPMTKTRTQLNLVAGKAYTAEADVPAGEEAHQLGAVTAHTNLDGTSSPTLVVGADDGWLYFVDGCSGKLKNAVPMGAAIGDVAFGDTDGDGLDEVLVSVGDGYLYGLRNAYLAAPDRVDDQDPDHGSVSGDVDETKSSTSATGAWSAVAGAAGYEVTVVGPDGDYLTKPAWKDVGNVFSTKIDGITLSPGGRYFFGVRAYDGSKRKSPDRSSDGVVYVPDGDAGVETGPDASGETSDGGDSGVNASSPEPSVEGGGCGCRVTTGRADGLVAGAGLLVALTLARRRKTQR